MKILVCISIILFALRAYTEPRCLELLSKTRPTQFHQPEVPQVDSLAKKGSRKALAFLSDRIVLRKQKIRKAIATYPHFHKHDRDVITARIDSKMNSLGVDFKKLSVVDLAIYSWSGQIKVSNLPSLTPKRIANLEQMMNSYELSLNRPNEKHLLANALLNFRKIARDKRQNLFIAVFRRLSMLGYSLNIDTKTFVVLLKTGHLHLSKTLNLSPEQIRHVESALRSLKFDLTPTSKPVTIISIIQESPLLDQKTKDVLIESLEKYLDSKALDLNISFLEFVLLTHTGYINLYDIQGRQDVQTAALKYITNTQSLNLTPPYNPKTLRDAILSEYSLPFLDISHAYVQIFNKLAEVDVDFDISLKEFSNLSLRNPKLKQALNSLNDPSKKVLKSVAQTNRVKIFLEPLF